MEYIFEDGWDYFGEIGCCLTCEEQEEGCLCYECKCRKCSWYESLGDGGKCTHPREYNLSWEDYEEMALRLKKKILGQYDREPHCFSALFSNGTLNRTIFYCYVIDIPHRISSCIADGKWRSLLLKNVVMEKPKNVEQN